MPWGLKRYQQTRELHFITFCCYHRHVRLGTELARNEFVIAIERVRKWYGFYVVGYVVMPEHVHLLISEPERGTLALSLQMLKQTVSRKLRVAASKEPFWPPRYYDFNVWSEGKCTEKLRYIHRNPVKRGLVAPRKNGHGAAFGTMLRANMAAWKSSRNGRHVSGNDLGFIQQYADSTQAKIPSLRKERERLGHPPVCKRHNVSLQLGGFSA
jgi:putative transposase